jgi:hypothetical protein
LFYWQPPAALMSAEIRYDPAGAQATVPKTVLPPHITLLGLLDSRHHHAVSGDGRRILLAQRRGPAGPPIDVIVNWTEVLK